MSWLWRFADPLLLRLLRRLEHLAAHSPSSRRDAELRRLVIVAPTAKLFRTTSFDVMSREQVTIAEFAQVHGAIRVATPATRVTIGRHTYVGPETMILAESSVTIGDYVRIANRVDILDSDAHSYDWRERRREAECVARGEPYARDAIVASPVVIEDDVWIGAKATILKGVRIGRGAIVAAGAVVVSDVAPFTLVGGVPSRVIRELEERA